MQLNQFYVRIIKYMKRNKGRIRGKENKPAPIYPRHEIRKIQQSGNPADGHPAYIFGKQGYYYLYISLTHSLEIKDEKIKTIPLEKNPDPNAKSPAFAKPYPEKLHMRFFGNKKEGWKLSRQDLLRMESIKRKKIRVVKAKKKSGTA